MSVLRVLLVTGGLFSVLALGGFRLAVAQEYSPKKWESAMERIREAKKRGLSEKDWAEMDPAFEFVINAMFRGEKTSLMSDPKSCAVRVKYNHPAALDERLNATVKFHLVNWKTLSLHRDGVFVRCVDTCLRGAKAKKFGGGFFAADTLVIANHYSPLLVKKHSSHDFGRFYKAMSQLARICPQSTTAY